MMLEEINIPREPLSIDKEKRLKLVVDLKNVLTVSEDSTGELFYVADKPKKVQEVADSVFSDVYQREKLKEASLDIMGRPVRYYRQISTEALLLLLESGHDNPVDHHDEPFSLDDKAFLNMLEYVLDSRDIELDNTSILDVIYKVFEKADKEEIDKVFGINGAETHWDRILSFIEENLHPDEIKKVHAIGIHGRERVIKYSPFMSVNPGGPRLFPPPSTTVIVEMVIPDSKVMVNNKNRFEMEREALVRGVDVSYISRIIVGDEAFRKLIEENQETPVGEFIAAHRKDGIREAHQQWLLKVPISETMPAKK